VVGQFPSAPSLGHNIRGDRANCISGLPTLCPLANGLDDSQTPVLERHFGREWIVEGFQLLKQSLWRRCSRYYEIV
jgi:hypothetical protein